MTSPIGVYHIHKDPGARKIGYTANTAIFETFFATGDITPRLSGTLCQVTIAISGAAASAVLSPTKAGVSLNLKDGNPIDNLAISIFEFAWTNAVDWDFKLDQDCVIEHIVVREMLNK